MIIDSHGHFTTAPAELDAYRGRQLSTINRPVRGQVSVTDDELRESLAQPLAQMRERGIDRMIFSPRASGMGHEIGNELTSRYWTEHNNDLIYRISRLYPDVFIPAGQLPQSPGTSPKSCLRELDRIVNELGFAGVNVNPDISGGGQPFTPPLSDRWWDPLWERLEELDVPALIHASATVNPALHLNGSHYTNTDTAAVFDLAWSDLFDRFPSLKIVVPHGGGSMPFHFNRHRALHERSGKKPFEEALKNIYFDTAIYDADSMEMLIRKVGVDNLLYASEPFGTADTIDPETGKKFDDTKSLIDAITWLSAGDKIKLFEGNARKLYSRANWCERAESDSIGAATEVIELSA
jgi:4-oxalmesaconate hydratase